MSSTAFATKTKAGTGYSQNPNSFEAGVEIATTVVNGAELSPHTLFLLFATPHHKVDSLIKGIRSVIGDNPTFLDVPQPVWSPIIFFLIQVRWPEAHLFRVMLHSLRFFMSQILRMKNSKREKGWPNNYVMPIPWLMRLCCSSTIL